MLPDERAIADVLLSDAIAASTNTTEQIDTAMTMVDDLAGSGAPWVDEWVRSMLRRGVAEELTKVRGKERRQAHTSRGTEVDVPAYGGVRRIGDDGRDEYHQLAFDGMTPDELESWIVDRQKSRDTLSREIQWAQDVLRIARAERMATCGPAIAELERRHA